MFKSDILLKSYFALIVAMLPLYIIRFQFGFFPSTLLECALAVFFLLAFYLVFMRKGLTLTLKVLTNTIRTHWLFFITLLFFLCFATLAIFLSDSMRSGLGIYKAYFIEPALLFLLLVGLSTRVSFEKPFLVGGGVLILWLFLLCVAQTFFQKFIFAPDEASLNRATGVFTTPNALGLLIGPIASIFGSFTLFPTQGLVRVLACFVIGLAGGIVVVSQSITSLLAFTAALFVMLILYLFFSNEKWSKFLQVTTVCAVFAMVLALLVFFAIFLPGLTPKKIGPNLPNDSLTIRFYLWRGAFAMLAQHQQGTGFSSFPRAYAPYRVYKEDNDRKGFADTPLYPHNMLLNFWSEIGIGGAILFFALCTYVLKHAIAFRNQPFGLGLVGAFVYLLIHGLTDVPYFKNDLALLFWILAAFALTLRKPVARADS